MPNGLPPRPRWRALREGRSAMMRLTAARLAAILLIVCGSAPQRSVSVEPGRDDAPGRESLVMRDDVRIPMRDGVQLSARLFLPSGAPQRWPVILSMTPYQRDGLWQVGRRFAAAGFVFAAVDVRGRGGSGGVFEPWLNEGQDGFDLVEWLAAQPFSTGAVGMWGGSYGGFVQWATAARRPPHLKSIVPAAAGLPAVDFPLNRNIMRPYVATWLALTSGGVGHDRFFADLPYQSAVYERLLRSGQPQSRLPAELGYPSPIFARFLEHPRVDEFWERRGVSAEEIRAITIPVLTIAGYWDSAQLSALEYYRRGAGAPGRALHYVIIGPFDHGGTRAPRAVVGGYKVDERALLDMFALDVQWYDWTLRGADKPPFLRDRINYFQVGENAWHSIPTLEAATGRRVKLWLAPSPGSPPDPSVRRLLLDASKTTSTALYRNDPGDLSKATLGTWYAGDWVIHKADVEALSGDGLLYETAPSVAPTRIAGAPVVHLDLAIQCPDADFRVRLFDVAADGSSVFLGQDRIRARYRDSLRNESRVRPGQFERYVFDRLAFVGWTVEPGHRLRLVVDTPNSIHDQRNFNSGKPVGEETRLDACATPVLLREGKAEGSHLVLPLAAD